MGLVRLATALLVFSAYSAAVPLDFTMTQVTAELNAPMHIHFGPFEASGRALVVEKYVGIIIVEPFGNSFTKETYLRLDDLHYTDETGAISVTTDPEWDEGQTWVYVYWAKSGTDAGMRISRFWHNENDGGLTSRADKGRQEELWFDTNGFGVSPMWHYGGKLSWGPDSKLYIGLGDKYTSSNAEGRDRYEGCIIRINKDGSIPEGNLPSYTKPAECWAHGFRNPFRLHWDLETERLYVANVGSNDARVAVEGLYLAEAGKHYGWPHCEGPCDNVNFESSCDCAIHESPIYSYDRGDGACIIGGEVLRQPGWPLTYNGAYFFADYTQGTIKYLTHNSNGTATVTTFHTDLAWIVSLEVDSMGNLWVTRFANWASGSLEKISYVGQDTAPEILSAQASVSGGAAPLAVTFTHSVMDATDQMSTLSVEWNFGDGTRQQVLAGEAVVHTYTQSGEFLAVLSVSDGSSTINSNPVSIGVGNPPVASIISPASVNGADITFRAGEIIALDGAASENDGSGQVPLSGTSVQWHLEFIHDEHTHPLGSNPTGVSTTFEVPSSGHSYEGYTGLRFSFTATSSTGLSTTSTITAWPEKVALTLVSDPPGAKIIVDGYAHLAPHVMTTMVEFRHTVMAPKSQCFNNEHHNLVGWPMNSEGVESELVVPDIDTVYTVRYEPTGQTCRVHLATASLGLLLDAAGMAPISPIIAAPTAQPTDIPTATPSVSPSVRPTAVPFAAPTIAPTTAPSETPVPTACSNNPDSYMASQSISCDSFPYMISNRCNAPVSVNPWRFWWLMNQFCQQSCFDAGVGYDGVDCGTGPEPTTAPSQTPTAAPAVAPTDPSPTTVAPVTDAPVTAVPVTATPTIAAPVTAAPITAAPDTAAPVTATPITAAPVTATPITAAPVTATPITAAPDTAAPVHVPTAAPIATAPSVPTFMYNVVQGCCRTNSGGSALGTLTRPKYYAPDIDQCKIDCNLDVACLAIEWNGQQCELHSTPADYVVSSSTCMCGVKSAPPTPAAPGTVAPTTAAPVTAEPPAPPVTTVCSNIPDGYMASNSISCDSFPYMISNRCNVPKSVNPYREWWVENKFCQQACFDAGVGYDGDACSPSIRRHRRNVSGSVLMYDTAEYRLHLNDRVGDVAIISAADSALAATGDGWFGRAAFYGEFIRLPTTPPSSLGGGDDSTLPSLIGPWSFYMVMQMPAEASGSFVRLADAVDSVYIELTVPPNMPTGWCVYVAVHNPDGTLIEYVNGNVHRTTSVQTMQWLGSDAFPSAVQLMSPTMNTASTATMDVAVALLYSVAMSTDERVKIEDYIIGEYFSTSPQITNQLSFDGLATVTAYSSTPSASVVATCPGNKVVQSVTFASFGNPAGGSNGATPTTLSITDVGSCHSIDSTAKVSRACLGQHSCTLDATADGYPAATECALPTSVFNVVGGGCCRDVNGGTGGASVTKHDDIPTLAACEAICEEAPVCTGIEYNTAHMCEVHTMDIDHTNNNDDCQCYVYEQGNLRSRLAVELACITPLLPASAGLATDSAGGGQMSMASAGNSVVVLVIAVGALIVVAVGTIAHSRHKKVASPSQFILHDHPHKLEWDDGVLSESSTMARSVSEF